MLWSDSSRRGRGTTFGARHTGAGRIPVCSARSERPRARGPPTWCLVADTCVASVTEAASSFLVRSSKLVKFHGRASLTVVGGGRGPLRPTEGPPLLAAAMAAACWVWEFGRGALRWEVDEWAEPRREMLSSTATSGMVVFMKSETRQVIVLEAAEEWVVR